MKAALFLLSLLFSWPGHAEIYKYVDDAGQVTYSNLPKRGAQRLNLEPAQTPVTPASNPALRKKETSTPPSFPRVDVSTQRRRDDIRRTVLEEELRIEERNLAEARSALKAGEILRYGELPGNPNWRARIAKLNEAVRLHENNVTALKKELSSVR